MDIPKGMAKRQSTFDWQTAPTHAPLHNNNSNTNNKNRIVRDKVLTMSTTTTNTTQIFININNLSAKNHSGIYIMKCLHVLYIFHEKLLQCVF